jgi:hypothetical protein
VNPLIGCLDLRSQLRRSLQQRLDGTLQPGRQFGRFGGAHLVRVTWCQAVAERLHQTPRAVDHRRPYVHQFMPRPDLDQILLRLCSSMHDRRQQLRIHSPQLSQFLGVDAIVLPPAARDQCHFSWIGHNHFVTQLHQAPAYPRRVRPGFQHHSHPAVKIESPHQFRLRLRYFVADDHLTRRIQNAVVTRSVPQVQADRQLLGLRLSRDLSLCRLPCPLST